MLLPNVIADVVGQLEYIVAKGQPRAKANRERKLRVRVQNLRTLEQMPPNFEDVCFVVWAWIKSWF